MTRAWHLKLVVAVSCLVGCGASRLQAPPAFQWPSDTSGSVVTTDSLALITHLHQLADDFVKRWRYYWEVSDRYRALSGASSEFRPPAGFAVRPSGTIVLPSRGQGNFTPPWMTSAWYLSWPPPPGVDTLVLAEEDSLWVAREARGSVARGGITRNTLLHCHPTGETGSQYSRVEAYIIEGNAGRRAICPGWYPPESSPPWDERHGIDNSIVLPFMVELRDARKALLSELRRGALLLPNDSWIPGQRVRFALDQSDTTEARTAVAECRVQQWWCVALGAYLMHVDGDPASADSVFALSIASMPTETRCEWTDLTMLLTPEDRREYQLIPCAEREPINSNFWWLADPQFNDRVNERRAEHFARKVLYTLRVGTSFHERWDMRRSEGGLAVEEMIVRYGWPSFSYWSGRSTDQSHYTYLGVSDSLDQAHGRFTTAEYGYPRYRMLPALSAAREPHAARDYDWAVSASAHSSIFPSDTIFWPPEHYDREAGPLVQLWNQHGMFRRQDNVLLAVASRLLPEDFLGATNDTLWGWLYSSTGPNSMRREQKGAIVGLTNVFKYFLASEPQLISLELHGQRPVGVMARARFGVAPPQPLSELAPGDFAISPPVFIRPTTPDQLPPNDAEQALSRMYGTSVFRAPEAVGIYWETYGVPDNDSVALTISIERHEPPPGLLRRIGIALRLANRQGGALTVRWNEEQAQGYMRVRSGSVPIQGRIMTLATSQLRPGEYTIVVSAARPLGVPITASRDFWIIEDPERR